MEQEYLIDLLYVVAFFLGGVGFALGPIIISLLLAPRTRQPQTDTLYECGMQPIGEAWVRFGIVYYLYALVFLAFAVDVLFLFPVALIYAQEVILGSALLDFIVIFLFIDTLALAVVYAWKKGVFQWERRV
ncbi:NADH-quinone oxidoreductase subunit A [Desulfurivibrio dismutans]|uniref:NADH-quinone oxidoreductase subunit A n=1 Tax=Desulfurivibrio dismutans TaxID=1398908 RepID=UPI0023D9F693|nr:NADH-quinone oxidoreductase subunit A [Desulfurivibrio alkaliphilus]MDF1614015.1 NADH-quinone oxidoreductase subunit A [Desulfurivibrio alkaliphilus]